MIIFISLPCNRKRATPRRYLRTFDETDMERAATIYKSPRINVGSRIRFTAKGISAYAENY